MVVIFWILCGLIAGMIGSSKGAALSSFFLGILLGPIGVIIALVSNGDRRPCPYCKELVREKAVVCPHCQRDIE